MTKRGSHLSEEAKRKISLANTGRCNTREQIEKQKESARKTFGTPKDRFWKKVDIKSDDECWEWKAHKNFMGYGVFGFVSTRVDLAHRVAWKLTYGDIPEDMQVLHRCDNSSCVNPVHLWLGNQKDNVKDCIEKGRHISPFYNDKKNECRKFSTYDVLTMRILYQIGIPITQLSKMYNAKYNTIRNICKRYRRKDI